MIVVKPVMFLKLSRGTDPEIPTIWLQLTVIGTVLSEWFNSKLQVHRLDLSHLDAIRASKHLRSLLLLSCLKATILILASLCSRIHLKQTSI